MTQTDWHQQAREATLTINDLIDGKKSPPAGAELISKHAPHSGRVLYEFGCGDVATVNQAVASAKLAFEDGRWRHKSLPERKGIIEKLAQLLGEHADTFALYETLDVGKPITNAIHEDVNSAIHNLTESVANIDKLQGYCGADGGTLAY